MSDASTRLVVVSNRLPVALKEIDGEWKAIQGSGGLVSALAPVLRDRGGAWIGWTGAYEEIDYTQMLSGFTQNAGYDLWPVHLTEGQVNGYYYGFANEIIWPLFHDFQSRCNFRPEYWRTYLEVNRIFAKKVAEATTEDDYVWVHDYHLMHVAWMLKEMGVKRRMGFFLHIPFPSPDIYLKLPWRAKLIDALLEYRLVGVHTLRDRRNFSDCINIFKPESKMRGRGPVLTVTSEWGNTDVGYFPISIDYKNFSATAKKPKVKKMAGDFQKALGKRTIILGVDRLDYTKGIPQRLEAIRAALQLYPELMGNISLVQIAVPSREEVPEYRILKERIEQLVGEINGQFTRPGYIPIHYQYRSLPREELVSYYRAAAMALVTPLRDGMNLVAKEYCACNMSRTGVLFLSEFAGAAAQLQNGAILVNPHDVEGVARAIHDAYYMDAQERRKRMRKMQETIRKFDIFWWVNSYMQAAFGRKLGDFPAMETDYFRPDDDEELHGQE